MLRAPLRSMFGASGSMAKSTTTRSTPSRLGRSNTRSTTSTGCCSSTASSPTTGGSAVACTADRTIRPVPFPKRLLFDGEDIVLDLRPHWWFFSRPAALLLVTLVVLIVARATDVGDWAVIMAAGVVLAALGWFAGRYMRWATTNFVLTSD